MNNKDIFKEQFKSKFEYFEVEVPEESWDKLSADLHPKKSIRKMILNWSGIAAAVAALILGGIFVLRQPKNITETTNTFSQKQDTSKVYTQPSNSPLMVISSVIQKKINKEVSQNNHQNLFSQNSNDNRLIEELYYRYLDAKEARKYLDDITTNTDAAEPENNEEYKADFADKIFNLDFKDETNPTEKEESKKDFSIAMAAKGGLNSVQKSFGAPVSLRSSMVANEAPKMMKTTAFATPENVIEDENKVVDMSEMVHQQPVSLGLMLSKNIYGPLSVETGIVYTQLNSFAKNVAETYKTKEKLQFHYIGIPINLNYNVFNYKNLSTYLSLGGMLEKDIYGRYSYIDTSENFMLGGETNKEVKVSVKQKNIQCSMSMGIGASYPILSKLNLYGRVGGSYYFNANNTYKTIYSDRKIVVDLNMGLRYDF